VLRDSNLPRRLVADRCRMTDELERAVLSINQSNQRIADANLLAQTAGTAIGISSTIWP